MPKDELMSDNERELLMNEFEFCEQNVHPHIVRVFELLEDDEHHYIVMELMKGGDLFSHIFEKGEDCGFTEAKAARVVN